MKLYKLLLVVIIFIFPITVLADSAASSIVMDINSGRILYERDIHSKHLIASTTKIMTCIIVLENSNIEKEIIVGEEVLEMVGTNIYISVGEKLKIKDLLYGLMLRSGNDAAQTLAYNTLGYDQFIKKMNDKAKEIGMKNTSFTNPHGLDDKTSNYSTAYDMALLSKYAYKNNIYRKIISTKKYSTKSSLKSYVWYNRMALINKYRKCIGGKNGYTPKAGKSLVSYAKDNELVLTAVSLDDSEIYENHRYLYEKSFSEYKNYIILDKDSFNIPNLNKNKYYINKSFSYPLLENELNNVTTLIEVFPVSKNGMAGNVTIKLNNDTIKKISIYEKKDKKRKDNNIFSKIKSLFIR